MTALTNAIALKLLLPKSCHSADKNLGFRRTAGAAAVSAKGMASSEATTPDVEACVYARTLEDV